MRKKCVRRTKYVRATLIVATMVVSTLAVNTGAQSSDPSTLQLLSFDSFQYLGGFRLPRETVNADNFAYGGKAIAYSPATNSMFVSSRANRVAEVTIPNPLITSDVNQMPFATFLQPFADPTEGTLAQVGTTGVSLSSLMVYGDRLYGTGSIFYDATNSQRKSHFSHSLQLNQSSFSGWSQVWTTGKQGYVSGYMSVVPAEWRTRLGGPVATGQCCIPIVTRTSWGPAAFTFDPAQVGQATVAASPLVYYTGEHPSLGHWSGANEVYGASAMMGGMAMIGGTRTALFIGRNGIGPYCYGNGTGNQALHGQPSPDGSHYCYDPTASDKGTHAYPYNFQIWAYDMNDLAAVKAGTMQPWEVMPYGVWPFELPTFEKQVRVGGISYDAERQLLYVTQLYADKDGGYQSRPIIHVFQLDLPPAPVPVTAVTVTADKAAPQLPNAPVTFTAAPADGVAPFQYKWEMSDGTQWTPAGSWNTVNSLTWMPATAGANYSVRVAVRSSWNSDDAGEATASMPYEIAAPVTAVSLTASHTAPQLTNTPMTFTAAATSGTAPYSYRWGVTIDDGVSVALAESWTTSNTFVWTPTAANASYRVTVRARSAGNNDYAGEATASMPFAIAVPPPPPPPPPSTSKVTAVTIAPDKVAPYLTGTAVTWSAAATGGSGALQYKWLVHNGYNWITYQHWSTGSTFTYVPGIAGGNKVSVWVKSGGSVSETAEASITTTTFAVSGPTMATMVPPPQTSAKVLAVFLSPDQLAPQAAGSTVTWSATPAGGTGAPLYKWFVYDGTAWVAQGGWTSSNTFTWTPASANPKYKISVWAKNATSTADAPEASLAFEYLITVPTP